MNTQRTNPRYNVVCPKIVEQIRCLMLTCLSKYQIEESGTNGEVYQGRDGDILMTIKRKKMFSLLFCNYKIHIYWLELSDEH